LVDKDVAESISVDVIELLLYDNSVPGVKLETVVDSSGLDVRNSVLVNRIMVVSDLLVVNSISVEEIAGKLKIVVLSSISDIDVKISVDVGNSVDVVSSLVGILVF
jgi:hypothetical protein